MDCYMSAHVNTLGANRFRGSAPVPCSGTGSQEPVPAGGFLNPRGGNRQGSHSVCCCKTYTHGDGQNTLCVRVARTHQENASVLMTEVR